MKSSTIHDAADCCMACGIARNRSLARKLEAAHVCKPGCIGMKRVDDRRAVVLFCSRCHRRQENPTPEPVMIDGREVPPITPANMAWLKYTYDREHYDDEFLEGLFGRRWNGERIQLDDWFQSEDAR